MVQCSGRQCWVGGSLPLRFSGHRFHLARLAFDDAQTREIETIVRDYLVANPEVLLESMQALEAKRNAEAKAGQSETIAGLRERLDASPAGTVAGNPQGDVTLVEFFDYNCGYCKRAASDLQVLLESDPKLKVVYKEIPVLGPASEAAARVSLAFRQTKPTAIRSSRRRFSPRARRWTRRAR